MDIHNLPDIDEIVVSSLELFEKEGLPDLDLSGFKRPLVVGSGNAASTGKILFDKKDAVFGDESNFEKKLEFVDGVIVISASGMKASPSITSKAMEKGLPVWLLTCNPDAPAKEHADKVIVSPKLVEPYTYNTSTYLGMLLSQTKENPRQILDFIREKVDPLIPELNHYEAFFLIVPNEFDSARDLFLTKFDELFGPMLNGRCFTPEQAKHARTLVSSPTEMFISFGYDNKDFGDSKLNIPLPANAGPAALMAIGYYVIGKIQKQNPPYFKDSIESYAKKASEIFGQDIKPIVD
ncbi:hypothetical protein ACFL1B_03180 [Nanoarchaeota archaeon]